MQKNAHGSRDTFARKRWAIFAVFMIARQLSPRFQRAVITGPKVKDGATRSEEHPCNKMVRISTGAASLCAAAAFTESHDTIVSKPMKIK